jgi:hypothetical protein
VLVERLLELGWIEGRTAAIEYRWAEGRGERYAEIAAEFVRLKVDVIVLLKQGDRQQTFDFSRGREGLSLTLAPKLGYPPMPPPFGRAAGC